MNEPVVEFVGKELGQHGPNVYFKEFSVTVNGERRSYKLGEFYLMRKDPRQPVCIAEFQLIWTNLKDGKRLAAAKLYFRPEDTKSGRLSEHGEDELMEADRHVPVYCEQVPSWEYSLRLPFGRLAYEGVCSGNAYVTDHDEVSTARNCCCSPTDPQNTFGMRTPVKILSFPAYCRYRASMKLISSGRKLPRNVMIARGAIEVDCPKTRVFFNRFKFQHHDMESFVLAENIRMPVFKGRPRKRKHSKTKGSNDVKKSKLEKENSNPESKLEILTKEDLKTENKQTYRIIAPPVNSNPERNVIHVKIENKKDLMHFKEIKEEDDMKKVVNLSNDFEASIMEKENIIYDEDDDFENASLENSKMGFDEAMEEELQRDIRRTRSLKKEEHEECPPSELVKNGKTGTILDEAFFREMKNGMKAAEGVDKEKMMKILVDACQDPEKFKRDLFIFMKQKGTPIVYVPKVGYTRVDLPKLFNLVVSNGGYRQVTMNHKWKKVYDEMALATTITSAATCMRRHYEKLLLPFEKHLRVKHKQDALASKTYAITSQASQPLVLTIKTIKTEKSPSASPELQGIARLPAVDTDETADIFQANCNYKPLGIDKEGCIKTETCESNIDASNDPCGTTYSYIEVPPATGERAHKVESVPQLSEPFSNQLKSTVNNIAVTKTNIHGSKYRQLESAQANTIPATSPQSDSVSTDTASGPYPAISSTPVCLNMHVPVSMVSASNKILPKQSSVLIPVISGIQTTQVLVPPSLTSPTASAKTVYPSHANEVTVITKARLPQSEEFPSLNFPFQNATLQNPPVIKKRRGRPPKHAKLQMNLSMGSVQNCITGRIDNTGSSNDSNVMFQSNSSRLDMNGVFPVFTHAKSMFSTSQSVVTTPSVSGTLMCASETEKRATKRGPVKMYEYVMTSDSMNAKLVKHKQGVISFPDVPEAKEGKTSRTAGMPTEALSPATFNRAAEYGELHQAAQLNGNLNYPRVETVMSFSTKGCLPSTLIPRNDQSNIHARRTDSDIDRTENMRLVNEEILEQPLEATQRCSEPRSVITGPPPLIPIHKDRKNSKQGTAVSSTSVQRGDASQVFKPSKQCRERSQCKNGSQQLSLMSDIRALKESFDVDTIIKPLTKTIDQSLEDLRRVTGKGGNRETSQAAEKEREALIRERHMLSRDPLYESKFAAVVEHAELRVDIDKIEGQNDSSFLNHQKVPRDKDAYQEYLAESEASHRLLRIASDDHLMSQTAHETTNAPHPSLLNRERDLSNFNNGPERGRRSHSAIIHERTAMESFDQRSSKMPKFSDDFTHSKFQESSYRSERGISMSDDIGLVHGDSSRITLHPHGIREQGQDPNVHRDSHRHGDSHHHRPHLHEHGPHAFYHDHHHSDHHHSDHHHSDHHHSDHHHNDHHHRNDLHIIDRHRSDLHRSDHHHSDHHHSDHHRSDHNRNGERHHNGHRFKAESPNKEFSPLHFDLHQTDHRTGRHIASYQPDVSYVEYPSHSLSALFPGGNSSPAFERKHIVMIDRHSPPPSSIHHSWYSTHHIPAIGKDGHRTMNNPMYWHQQVHH